MEDSPEEGFFLTESWSAPGRGREDVQAIGQHGQGHRGMKQLSCRGRGPYSYYSMIGVYGVWGEKIEETAQERLRKQARVLPQLYPIFKSHLKPRLLQKAFREHLTPQWPRPPLNLDNPLILSHTSQYLIFFKIVLFSRLFCAIFFSIFLILLYYPDKQHPINL